MHFLLSGATQDELEQLKRQIKDLDEKFELLRTRTAEDEGDQFFCLFLVLLLPFFNCSLSLERKESEFDLFRGYEIIEGLKSSILT